MQFDTEKIAAEVVQELKKSGIFDVPSVACCGASAKTDVAKALEHSMLNKDVTEDEILKACAELKKSGAGFIVVPQWHVAATAKCLKGSDVKLVTVVSFPNGGQSLACKLQEVRDALRNGADEIDVVPNFDMILRGKMQQVRDELDAILSIAKPKMKVKINIEWGMFTNEQKADLLKMAVLAGADFVKVQHFLAGGKALVEEVQFIRSVVGNQIGIKIDGGIKTAAYSRELMAAGANRMGVSATFAIIGEA